MGGGRPSSKRKRNLKNYLLNVYGNGLVVECSFKVFCNKWELLDYRSLTVDRIVPEKYGGRYTTNNIQAACSKCNGSKYAEILKDLQYYKGDLGADQ